MPDDTQHEKAADAAGIALVVNFVLLTTAAILPDPASWYGASALASAVVFYVAGIVFFVLLREKGERLGKFALLTTCDTLIIALLVVTWFVKY